VAKLRELYSKYRQIIMYIIFGILTTAVSLGAWYLTMKVGVLIMHDENGEPTVLLDALGSTTQWIVGVVSAFVTSKKWVFVDADKGLRVTARQFAVFTGSRVLTYLMELVLNIGTILLFQWLGYRAFSVIGFEVDERIWAKAITSVVIVILNYLISKLLVFRKKPKNGEK